MMTNTAATGAQDFGIFVSVGAVQSSVYISATPGSLVSVIKTKIHEQEKLPMHLQVLSFANQVLDDNRALVLQRVFNQSNVTLSLKRDAYPTTLTCRLKLAQLCGNDLIRTPSSRTISVLSLFTEVSKRGGSHKVTLERKWDEVAMALHCFDPPSQIGSILKQRFEESKLMRIEAMFPELVEEVLNFASHEAGARQTGLPPIAMSPMELLLFPELVGVVEREKYLACRNHLLQRWCLNCTRALDFELDIRQALTPPALSKEWDGLLRIAFFALETLGHLNWGCLTQQEGETKRFIGSGGGERSIIVLGAGLAGLACALQLARFGHQVEVLEARNRVGGRVHTDLKTFTSPVDLGAMLITGVSGHPASVLTHQLQQKKYAVGERCPIYSLGALLDEEMDNKIERRFNAMLTAAAAAAAATPTQDVDETKRKRGRARNHNSLFASAATCNHATSAFRGAIHQPTSKYSGLLWTPEVGKWRVFLTRRDSGARMFLDELGLFTSELEAALAHDIALAERNNGELLLYADFSNGDRFPQDFINLQDDNAQFATRQRELLESLHNDVPFSSPSLDEWFSKPREPVVNRFSSTIQPLDNNNSAVRDYSLMERMLEHYDDEEEEYKTPDVARLENIYLSWHFANLEYACATSLEHISNANWDQDDEHDWEGAHVLLPNGFGVLTEGMRRKLQQFPNAMLRLGKPAKVIDYSAHNAVCISSEDGTQYFGDAVVCTASLGVLKDPTGLQFTPKLPDWKQTSINRLGYGNLNKIVFEFDTVFWDMDLDIFGRVVHPETQALRGECYMYWALNRINPQSAILLALVAGDAADEQETRSDEDCVARALLALEETFPLTPKPFPKPKSWSVTRWRSDPFARGSYSYVSVGSNGDDYDLLAEVVDDRVFFAGEATCREHPATTGGALVSGLREASKLASLFGRATTLRDEGDDSKLVEVLRRIQQASKLVKPLTEAKMNVVQYLSQHMGKDEILTARDLVNDTTVSQMLVETWVHGGEPVTPAVMFSKDRERAFRAAEIASRLPASWDEVRKQQYIADRLGSNTTTQQVAGFWV